MAARFVSVVAADLEGVMRDCGFSEVSLPGTFERVFERAVVDDGNAVGVVVRVYTTLPRGAGVVRERGADAIRVVLVDRKSGRAVWSATRTHRTQGWRERMVERMREAWRAVAGLPRCPECGRAMVERKSARTGRPFLGCAGYPECRGVRWVERSA